MAKCAYLSGTNKWSEWEGCWKEAHSDPDRVRLIEVMLPPNAPREYADPQTLWNAVDAAEKDSQAQTARVIEMSLPRELTYEQNLALVREYCQQQFVDKGMCCNFYYHDSGNGNPHVHIMLTMRAMDEQGQWLPKSRMVYALDENGNRIKTKSVRYRRNKVFTVDWDDRKYGEIWRHEWEVCQNNALEDAGRSERVDMRSLKRQGIEDRLPQAHLGPAAAAMERKGIVTDRGNENRKRMSFNQLLSSVQNTIKSLTGYIRRIRKLIADTRMIEKPDDYNLSDVLIGYLDMRKAGRLSWSNYARQRADIRDIQEGFDCIAFLKKYRLFTVGDLLAMLEKTDEKVKTIKEQARENKQTIRDIDDFFGSLETIKETQAVREKFDKIKFPSHREKYLAEHRDELDRYTKAVWLRDKLVKKLDITVPFTTSAQRDLKARKAKLETKNEQMRPDLIACQSDLDQLKKLRYWTRKVIPEALPDPEKSSFQNELDSRSNRRELKKDMDAAIASVTPHTDTQTREPDSRQKPLQRRTNDPIH